MGPLQVGIVGFDITPRIHPEFGAWGTTPFVTTIDMPLLARCIAFEHMGRRLLWFGSDLFGETVAEADATRHEIAEAIGMEPDDITWSTSQTHSGGARPGSTLVGNASGQLSKQAAEFIETEQRRLMRAYAEAAREALGKLQPVDVWAGRGHCDSVSYNARFPMPTGGVKFTRHHGEGLQSGKPFDTTIGLVRFDDKGGNPIGGIFNFGCRVATMLNDKYISSDWVGSARKVIEDEIGGKPVMFAQGFCADVNCYYFFGTPKQTRITGTRLGEAAAQAMSTLVPARAEPLAFAQKTIDVPCRPMYTREELEAQLVGRRAFIAELEHDPAATWFCGINVAEQLPVEVKIAVAKRQIRYLEEGMRMLETAQLPPSSLPITLGALRFGDIAALLSPGGNFTLTGMQIRTRSPFVHTLICGETNGIFGYMGTDDDIDRGGYEADSSWKALGKNGFRLAPAKGVADRIVNASIKLLRCLNAQGSSGRGDGPCLAAI